MCQHRQILSRKGPEHKFERTSFTSCPPTVLKSATTNIHIHRGSRGCILRLCALFRPCPSDSPNQAKRPAARGRRGPRHEDRLMGARSFPKKTNTNRTPNGRRNRRDFSSVFGALDELTRWAPGQPWGKERNGICQPTLQNCGFLSGKNLQRPEAIPVLAQRTGLESP